MVSSTVAPASIHQYELNVDINASCDRVWKAIFEETNSWWLPDFHVAGPNSVVTFDPKPGGLGLIEESSNGNALQWYGVQMILPADFKVYLVGYIAPEWGGPTTSSLKLSLTPSDSGCILNVVDARHGHVDEKHVQSFEDGWKQLFTDGLKAYVETNSVA